MKSNINMASDKAIAIGASLAEGSEFELTKDGDSDESKNSNSEEDDEVLDETDVVPLKDDEEFQAAVNEVKEAAKNITTSSVQFTSAIVTKGPGIFWRMFTALVTKEIRYVSITLNLKCDCLPR